MPAGQPALRQPVLNLQAADAFELTVIRSHDSRADGRGVRGDQHVVAADRLAGCFELGANAAIFPVRWGVERQDVDLAEQILDCFVKAGRPAFAEP